MLPTKIVIIGAGSVVFGLNTVSAIMRSRRLSGSQLTLVDQDSGALDQMGRLAKRLNQEWDAKMQVTTSTGHNDALHEAEFVVMAIEVPPRETLWRSDFEIPLRYGVRQPYAENGGPGGFAHAARNIKPVMEIVREMEKACPNAWLINFTNPMVRICDAVNRYSRIKVVGLCHQILVGYAMVGMILAEDLGILAHPGISSSHASPEEIPLRRKIAAQALKRIQIKAAGLNHFTWMLELHDRQNGQNLYPLFAKRWATMDSKFEPLTRRIYEIFGLFPIPGDEHLCEYLPWVSDPITKPWDKFDLSLYDWDAWTNLREEDRARIAQITENKASIQSLLDSDSEGALEIIENIAGAGDHYHLAVNLPNTGQITNLPYGAIVETPAMVTGGGVHGENLGSLPETIAALCRRELEVVRLCVDAVVKGDRQTAQQCLLLDPVITDLDVAKDILDDYLLTYKPYLPQFWE